MKNPLPFFLCCFFFINISIQEGYTQRKHFSSNENSSLRDVINSYFDTIQNQIVIYNSKIQEPYPFNVENLPYLRISDYVTGELSYDGILYSDVALRLDLYKDELILLEPVNKHNIVLKNELVDYVKIHGRHICYYQNREKTAQLDPGYYILLHKGSCEVLERESYLKVEKIEGTKTIVSFRKKNMRYVLKDGVYYAANNKKAILNIFGSHKKQLEPYIKQRKLNFNKDIEHSLVSVAKQYELLIGGKP
ncbi:MAG: hypothetical protein LBG19_03970 [Prevotellaceae bacterium]|jgi:hypothetical protein|nr:hypothetical protein [Prevotellaceae bacterium]